MGRYYSEDFRLRVLKRVDAGMSKMAAYRTFGVSRSTLDDWLRLRQAQGHVRDKAMCVTSPGGARGTAH